jgi:hypothetical protein
LGEVSWDEYSDLVRRLIAKEKEPTIEDALTFFEGERFRCHMAPVRLLRSDNRDAGTPRIK